MAMKKISTSLTPMGWTPLKLMQANGSDEPVSFVISVLEQSFVEDRDLPRQAE